VIESIKDKETAKVFAGQPCKRLPPDIQESAREKMLIIGTITRIDDLWAIPSLRAEKLSGDRKGQWSIRINKQWRICFDWDQEAQAASNLEITDYH